MGRWAGAAANPVLTIVAAERALLRTVTRPRLNSTFRVEQARALRRSHPRAHPTADTAAHAGRTHDHHRTRRTGRGVGDAGDAQRRAHAASSGPAARVHRRLRRPVLSWRDHRKDPAAQRANRDSAGAGRRNQCRQRPTRTVAGGTSAKRSTGTRARESQQPRFLGGAATRARVFEGRRAADRAAYRLRKGPSRRAARNLTPTVGVSSRRARPHRSARPAPSDTDAH